VRALQTATEPLRTSARSAFALVPNVVWFKSFGKVLFMLCDLLVALLIVSIQRARHPPGEHSAGAVKARETRPRSTYTSLPRRSRSPSGYSIRW
jgi:hypothetical protein